ncbi:MAG: CHASE2 domain-containing protein, partial [Pseudanabaena sp. ELA607]
MIGLITGCILILRAEGWLEKTELWLYDYYISLRPALKIERQIVILEQSTADINYLGHQISDHDLAELLQKVLAQDPQVIGLDLRYQDATLNDAAILSPQVFKVIETAPNMVINPQCTSLNTAHQNPLTDLNSKFVDTTNHVILDGDGRLRRVKLFPTNDRGEYLCNLGLVAAIASLEQQGIYPKCTKQGFLQLQDVVIPSLDQSYGSYTHLDVSDYQIMLDYQEKVADFRQLQQISFEDVLTNRVATNFFRDKIVLVSNRSRRNRRYFRTPYSYNSQLDKASISELSMYGIVTNQILNLVLHHDQPLQVLSDVGENLWISAWAGLGIVIVWWSSKGLKLSHVILILILSTISMVMLLSMTHHLFISGWWLPVFPCGISFLAAVLITLAWVYLREMRYLNHRLSVSLNHLSKLNQELALYSTS